MCALVRRIRRGKCLSANGGVWADFFVCFSSFFFCAADYLCYADARRLASISISISRASHYLICLLPIIRPPASSHPQSTSNALALLLSLNHYLSFLFASPSPVPPSPVFLTFNAHPLHSFSFRPPFPCLALALLPFPPPSLPPLVPLHPPPCDPPDSVDATPSRIGLLSFTSISHLSPMTYR
jgi:Zn-dependent protease